LAIQIIVRLNQTLDIDLPLGSLFQMPTVADLAQAVAAKQYVLESDTLLDAVDNDDQESFIF
ncbi:MAG: phosphopantetheine-binding protein, partial [Chloroflexota bacterium]